MQDRITFEQQHTQAEERLMAYIDQHKQRMFGMLQQLVAIESVNHVSSGGEANCAPLIEGWYRDLGLETEVYYPDDVMGDHPAHLAGRGTDTRPNVGGLYRGAEGKRCVMLAAHTDTMPIGDRADWRHDPLGVPLWMANCMAVAAETTSLASPRGSFCCRPCGIWACA